ncbi:RICIN domain-containing protein [Paenibacillus alginolyticus]|uniref:RICIN domain-containing protein n=1 Tax=Paenibacillus alginolyticus TaxID=59839 RepID=UPI0009FEBDD1
MVSKKTGKVINISGNSYSNGANVDTWNFNNGDNQKFKLESVGNGVYVIRAKSSSEVLDVAGNFTSNGANVDQWAPQ